MKERPNINHRSESRMLPYPRILCMRWLLLIKLFVFFLFLNAKDLVPNSGHLCYDGSYTSFSDFGSLLYKALNPRVIKIQLMP